MPGSVNSNFINAPVWQQQLLTNETLDDKTIHIWMGNTADLLKHYDDFFLLLNQWEQTAALRYYQLKDQQRYVIQHGVLRILLGKYLGVPQADISYIYNQTKKPYLANGACFFNISHSHGYFLIALSDEELGVDIEYINPEFQYQDIALQYFSAGEMAYIDQSENPNQAFFLLWTRKEALLKACGTGIDDNLPALPALNGKHALPVAYPFTEYLTSSFFIPHNFMGSVTYMAPKRTIKFYDITSDEVTALF